MNEGDLPNWQHQDFNFGSITCRPVTTTPCSPGIQQLIGAPHSSRLQEVLCGVVNYVELPRQELCVPLLGAP